ncbi:MAG: 8-oxo-dGTP diphosphatase MutT, partial [Bacilli bacterium]
CDIEVEDHIHTAEYVAVTGKRIVLHFYRCHLRAGLPEPREHAAITWVDESRLTQIPWAPADFEAVNIIIKNKGKELWI